MAEKSGLDQKWRIRIGARAHLKGRNEENEKLGKVNRESEYKVYKKTEPNFYKSFILKKY